MKKILFSILAAWMMISCEPTITYNPDKDYPDQEVPKTSTDPDDNFTGSLEDPVENPEQEW